MKKYLVIGNPINHSLSPKLHNHWLKENNINAVYDKKKLMKMILKILFWMLKNKKLMVLMLLFPLKKKLFLSR